MMSTMQHPAPPFPRSITSHKTYYAVNHLDGHAEEDVINRLAINLELIMLLDVRVSSPSCLRGRPFKSLGSVNFGSATLKSWLFPFKFIFLKL
ncbi:uncharacterized protein PAC_01896 [Phialocephala subalpina]|uniref:Uncharacterized protein n=1 Tax=Phialocephala subalpina TaxID=576137 RepID=A0A1L7WGX5_9HELO|nr:uncharacterized protein PAC_01896 [Phialocephala subalpina]